eukprot:SAG11_NODE_2572_length_3210_cov_18.286725_4_plen_90_part_00
MRARARRTGMAASKSCAAASALSALSVKVLPLPVWPNIITVAAPPSAQTAATSGATAPSVDRRVGLSRTEPMIATEPWAGGSEGSVLQR